MKKFFIILSVMTFCFSVFAQNVSNGQAIISGKATAVPDSTEMLLYKWDGNTGTLIGKGIVINGNFRFEIPGLTNVISADLMTSAPGFPSMGRKLYIAPGAVIEIEGNSPLIHTWPVKSNVKEQIDYDRFLYYNEELWNRHQENSIAFSKNEKSKWQFQHLNDSISRIIDRREITFLGSVPVTEVWLDLFKDKTRFIKKRSNDEADELTAMFERLPDSVKSSPKGEIIKAYLYPEVELAVGDKIPDSPLYDLDGNEHHFSEFLGKWVLVDIWSTGCGPCIMAARELNELKKDKSDAYEIVSLSIDSDKGWRDGTSMFNLTGNNWNEGVEDRGLYRRLPRYAVPAFMIISPDGFIRDIWHGHSKGIYGRKMRYYTRPKIIPSYSESDGTRIINNPEYDSNTTDCVLDIAKIEIDDNGTKVYFNLDYIPKYWIELSPKSFLATPDGRKYAIIGSEGITPGEHLYPDRDGKGSFSITFEPIPASATEFDFIEDDYTVAWTIKGIKIKQ